LIEAGLKAATMLVLALPPKNGFRINVSLDSRYGTTARALPDFPAFFASVLITLPKIMRDLLMFAPSAKRAPSAPVLPALSEPAKSIRLILLISSLSGLPSALKYFYLKIIIETV
jgi:hypothetical protein